MTENVENQEIKPSDKELNFRALEQKYQKKFDDQEKRHEAIEQRFNDQQKVIDDDDDDDEPYVDKKKLTKTLAKFGEYTQKQTKTEIQSAVNAAMQEDKQQRWLAKNADFYDVMKHADKLALKDDDLAEDILSMPDSFARQKIVYKHIKALGLDRPETSEPTVQEKIDANRRSPFYQPSNVGTAPHSTAGDFSQSGQKNAYDKMKELQKNLRL